MKVIKRVWFCLLILASTLLIILPVGIFFVIAGVLSFCLETIFRFVTIKNMVADTYKTPLPYIKSDLQALRTYCAEILEATFYFGRNR